MINKTILITGSSKGIGKQLALEFAGRGHDIVLHGRSKKSLEQAKKEIEEKKVQVSYVLGDIRLSDTVDALFKIAKQKNIDILVNNIGIYLNKGVQETSDEEIQEVIDVNFLSIVKLTKVILPLFQEKKAGLIININSMAGKRANKNESIYSASKHALKGFFNCLKLELMGQGIRIVDFYFGAVKTQNTKSRKDYDFLIQSDEAARFVVNNCENYTSLTASEIDVYRIK